MIVTVYSLPVGDCIKCKAVEIFLRRRGISVEKVMLDENPEAMQYVKELGYSEAPVIVLKDGGGVIDHWSGFSIERMTELADRVAA